MIHQYKVESQERIKNCERERERERENNMKIIENNMRRKIRNKIINTKLLKSCYIYYVIK